MVTLSALSLVIWTLIVVTTIKYVCVAMSIDNNGEGGILALLSLLGVKTRHRPVIVAVGLFGAALIYGDGAITPAISVLSALEGLDIAVPGFAPYVLPVSVVIWCPVAISIAAPPGSAELSAHHGAMVSHHRGARDQGHYPSASVLAAIDPRYGVGFLFSGGFAGFLVLGAVFLCVTGAEARCMPIWAISAPDQFAGLVGGVPGWS